MRPRFAAWTFTGLVTVVGGFQLALALGAPWGRYAMGGAFPGAYPPLMRAAAIVQLAVLAVVAIVVLSRAGLVLASWRAAARRLIWGIVGLLAVALVLNLVTPSPVERAIWAPVTLALLFTALRVAVSGEGPISAAPPKG